MSADNNCTSERHNRGKIAIYRSRAFPRNCLALDKQSVINDKLINVYISYRSGEYESTAYIHQRQDKTRKITTQVSDQVEMIKQIKSLEESCTW